MILTDEKIDKALSDMSTYVSNMDYSRAQAIECLTVLSQAISELKMRRIMKVKNVKNTSSPGEGS